MFELSKFELSGTKYKTLLSQVQGTWEFVRNNEMFELSGIRINECVLYNQDRFKHNTVWVIPIQKAFQCASYSGYV